MQTKNGLTTSAYIKQHAEMVSRLESSDESIRNNIQDSTVARLLHAALGCVTESGELANQMKRVLAYGKTLDEVNVKEELGDMLWYIQLACNVCGWTLMDLIASNTKKLSTRYPDKFDADKAINRNLGAERKQLEEEN